MNIAEIKMLASSFRCNETGGPENEDAASLGVRIDISGGLNNELLLLRVMLGVHSTGSDNSVEFSIVYAGEFQLAADETDAVDRLIKINCPGILFPFVREHLADLSRRAGLEPILLEPVNFVALARAKEEMQSASKD